MKKKKKNVKEKENILRLLNMLHMSYESVRHVTHVICECHGVYLNVSHVKNEYCVVIGAGIERCFLIGCGMGVAKDTLLLAAGYVGCDVIGHVIGCLTPECEGLQPHRLSLVWFTVR